MKHVTEHELRGLTHLHVELTLASYRSYFYKLDIPDFFLITSLHLDHDVPFPEASEPSFWYLRIKISRKGG